jgi:putative ABC transport system permease protein
MPLVARLAWRNLRARPGQAVLLLIALCVATTVLSMALAVNQTGNGAWERVWNASRGADLVVFAGYTGNTVPPGSDLTWARDRMTTLTAGPGVTAVGGPWVGMAAAGEIGGESVLLDLTVRDTTPSAVDQPVQTAGQWLDGSDGVVLEDSLASILHVSPGDTITIAGVRLPVRGAALSVDALRYGRGKFGASWISRVTADRLHAAGVRDREEIVKLKFANRDDAQAFAEAHSPGRRNGGQIEETVDRERFVELDTWQYLRDQTHDDLDTLAVTLLVIGTMLAGLSLATAAVLVAGRMAAQIRQIGTLKAIGVTPRQVTSILLVEYLALAGLAAATGLVTGTLLAPLLARSERALYGAPEAPPVTWGRAGIVLAVVIAVVLLATVRPALRGTRQSTLRSLAADVRPPRRARLTRVARRLPLPVALGLRTALRRPGRTAIHAAGLTLAIAMVIMGLALADGWQRMRAGLIQIGANQAAQAAQQALIRQILVLVVVAIAVLITIAMVNTVVVAIFAAHDSARGHAILRTLGATPRQTVLSFMIAQLTASLIACAFGLPLGIALFDIFATGLAPARLSALTYVLVAVGTQVLYALIVITPARLLAARPVTPLLTYE